jgi:hypothetical protein
MATKQEVATQESAGLPAVEDEFLADIGGGMENVTSADLLIPRLTIIQKMSPQIDKHKPEYIKGAEEGDICDVGLGQLWKEDDLPLSFLPVYYRKDFLEWAPRAQGGGLVAIHATMPQDVQPNPEKPMQMMRKGNLVAETLQFYGLNLTADGRPTFIPMTSTQLKKGRGWLTLAQNTFILDRQNRKRVAPLYYHVYHLSVVREQNPEGSWMGWKVTQGPKVTELEDWKALVEKAKEFRQGIIDGERQAAFGEGEAPASPVNSDNEPM